MNETTPKYMIGVAAELVGMHPQTLRMYESRGLVRPRRTAGGTRLYSDLELQRLRRITELASGLGLSLQGVEHVLRLEDEIRRLEQQVQDLSAALDEAARAMQAEVESVHRSYRREIVPYAPPGAEIVIRRRRPRA
ncbi:MAG: heat shock protein transcriptional repressor HspR [Actinomycetota bacterium]